jgi:predicted transcriptional regulator
VIGTFLLWKSCAPALDPGVESSYTFGMKTAVSIPDEVFHQAEQFARRTETSRSALYARALAEYVARHTPDQITDAMNRVCDEIGLGTDPFPAAAARWILERSEW